MVNIESGVLTGQFFGNYGMVEIYVNILAGLFLFVASLAAVTMNLSYARRLSGELRLIGSSIGPGGIKMAERGLPGWQYISVGVLFSGLIGFGEVMGLFFNAPIAIIFYRYLTVMAPPVSLYFFYIGIKKHVKKEMVGFVPVRFVLLGLIFYITVGGLSLVTQYYSASLQKFFMYLIFLPVLIFSGIVFKTAWQAYERYLLFMPTVSSVVLATATLALVTLIGQISIALGYGFVYILSQAVKDILICVTATSIVAYGGAVRMLKKQRI